MTLSSLESRGEVDSAAARRLSTQTVLPMIERAERAGVRVHVEPTRDVRARDLPRARELEENPEEEHAELVLPYRAKGLGKDEAERVGFALGSGIGALNGRSALRSGFRQVLVGALAAGVTYPVGRLIGTSAS